MPIYEIKGFGGGISEYEDRGIPGAFKFAKNIDIRKRIDSITSTQALVDEGISQGSPSASISPSASTSPSASPSPTPSPSSSQSPSSSVSSSASPSTGISPSPSVSPSASASPSASTSPSSSNSASPSPSSGLVTVFEDLILTFVESKDGYLYGFGNTGCIYRRDTDGYWMRVYKTTDGAITGAAEWYSSSGKVYLYFATSTILYKKDISGSLAWNDVQTVGDLTASDYHTMKQAGGALVITNGEFLAYVGYDDSFSNEVTDFIPGNISKTLVERNGRAIIGTARASDPTRGVNAAIDSEVPLAQVGSDGEIFYSNMTDSIPVTRFPGGGKVNPGGVANSIKEVNFFEWEEGASSWIDKQSVGNLSLWGVYGATSGYNGIYTYGRKSKNQPFVLNLEYELDVDEIGAVIVYDGQTIASYKDGISFGVKATSTTTKAIGVYEGLDFKAPVKRPQNITNWKMAELLLSPLPSGSSVEFWYRLDKNGSFVQATTDTGATSFSTANGKKAVFFIQADGQIFEPRIVTNPIGNTTPEVHRARIYFE